MNPLLKAALRLNAVRVPLCAWAALQDEYGKRDRWLKNLTTEGF